jgi:uncharacterized membrane protein YkvA (DUF1232 family)
VSFFQKLKEFLQNVANDERIPSRDKKIILGMIALIISPVDLIPDWIPFFGQLDDLVLIAFVMDYYFTVLDSNVLLSHYPWGMKSYIRLKTIAKFLQFLVPRFMKKKLWTYVGDPY